MPTPAPLHPAIDGVPIALLATVSCVVIMSGQHCIGAAEVDAAPDRTVQLSSADLQPTIECTVVRHPVLSAHVEREPSAEPPDWLAQACTSIASIRAVHVGSPVSLDLLRNLSCSLTADLTRERDEEPCPQRCPRAHALWADGLRALEVAVRLVRDTVPLAEAAIVAPADKLRRAVSTALRAANGEAVDFRLTLQARRGAHRRAVCLDEALEEMLGTGSPEPWAVASSAQTGLSAS